MGAVIHTLNPRLHASELGVIASDAQDRAIVVDESLLGVFESFRAAQPFEHVIVVSHTGDVPPGAIVVRKGSRDRWREMAPAWLDLCTSGHAWNAIGRPFGGCLEPSAMRSSGRPLAAGAAASASAGCTDLATCRAAIHGRVADLLCRIRGTSGTPRRRSQGTSDRVLRFVQTGRRFRRDRAQSGCRVVVKRRRCGGGARVVGDYHRVTDRFGPLPGWLMLLARSGSRPRHPRGGHRPRRARRRSRTWERRRRRGRVPHRLHRGGAA